MFSKLTNAERETIQSAVIAGEYSILLGAGVSIDSSNYQGSHLPLSNTLRADLCTLTGANPNSSLQRIFSALKPEEVKTHVIDRFRVAKAGETVLKMVGFLWHRIFTFNIDDALEQAFDQGEPLQNPVIFNYNQGFVEFRELTNVQIVHLHGWVRDLETQFVFSHADYVRVMQTANQWMSNLSEFIGSNPFIIAGTFLEEPDLEYYLAYRTAKTPRADRAPSILIEPFPDRITRLYCNEHGLLLYEGTAAAFFDELAKIVPSRKAPYDLVPQSIRELFPSNFPVEKVSSFSSDFELVPSDVEPSKRHAEFMYGHEPSWKDLAASADVGRSLANALLRFVDHGIAFDQSSRIAILLDEAGTGKTTLLRRVAMTLTERRYTVLMCSALSRLDATNTAEALDEIAHTVVLIVDNFADQATAIAEIFRSLKSKNVFVIGSERRYRLNYLDRVLSSTPFEVISGLRLRNNEVKQLVDRYVGAGLLSFAAAAISNVAQADLSREPIAVACCRLLNDLKPLQRIVRSLLEQATPASRLRYLIVAVARYCYGGGVRYEIVLTASGRQDWEEQFAESFPLRLTYDSNQEREFILPMNVTIASSALENVDRDELLKAFVLLANGTAAKVNRRAYRERTPEARLAGRIFDFDEVVDVLLKDRSEEFYNQTEDAWRWNSRYWEQKALLYLASYLRSRDMNRYESLLRSIQHARHAVSVEDHPLPLTTLGKILIAASLANHALDASLFNEGFQALSRAISMESARWSRIAIQPLITLFRGTKDYLGREGRLNALQVSALQKFVALADTYHGNDENMRFAMEALCEARFQE